MTPPGRPVIATNREGEIVADAINARLRWCRENLRSKPQVDFASAYFNLGGYVLLADELDHPARVRLLLGAEPLTSGGGPRRVRDEEVGIEGERQRLSQAVSALDSWLAAERDLLGFDLETDVSAQRLINWLRSGRVEVRRLTERFLHGKAFVLPVGDADSVLVGSSNFTYAGLAKNAELNLASYDPAAVHAVTDWFEEQWSAAEDFDLAALYEDRYAAHEPWIVYLRLLKAVYGRDLTEEIEKERDLRLASFQRAGVARALRYLEQFHGVLIADDVGLGKTFIAGELLRRAVIDERKAALVVAPAVLRDGAWRKFIQRYIGLPVEIVSYEQLAGDPDLNPLAAEHRQSPLLLGHRQYALVIVDEAHNVRNPSTQRSAALTRLVRDANPKDVVLLTATPVNNSLWDAYELVRLLLPNDAALSDRGVTSIRSRFARAMDKDPEDLSSTDLFDVLDAVTVRRTRGFVKKHYPLDVVKDAEGNDVRIVFPDPVPSKIDYDLERSYPGFVDTFRAAIEPYDFFAPLDPNVLSMARYMPSLYLNTTIAAKKGVEQYEIQLGGLLRSTLLKRFESSARAFASTCAAMIQSHDVMIDWLDDGKVLTGRAITEWLSADGDTDEFDEAIARKGIDEPADAGAYDVSLLRNHLESDRALLLRFKSAAEAVEPKDDPKLQALVEALVEIAAEADREGVGESDIRDKRKVLVFSYFADTVEWIRAFLEQAVSEDPRLRPYAGRVTSVTGSDDSVNEAMFGFAPCTTDPPDGRDDDRFDILIATDKLAEGVNLQQARHIINFDLPWNPMRLVQRHGRIDRIGSTHEKVFLRSIYPDKALDALLQLEARLQRKLHQAMATFGGRAPLPGWEEKYVNYADDTRRTLDELAGGNAEFLLSQGGQVLGEEFRETLRRAFEDERVRREVGRLPWAAGSGFVREGGQPGYVFCIQVGDHPEPFMRYVTPSEGGGWQADASLLTSLLEGRPPLDDQTPRMLSDATYAAAYDAWDFARRDVLEAWTLQTDPANLVQATPPALVQARAAVEEHWRTAGLSSLEAAALSARLSGVYRERVLRLFREALRDDDPKQRVLKIAALADSEGLVEQSPPDPLPPILPEDVHLLCWLAITV